MTEKTISFEPVSGFEMPRFAGIPSFMRLPVVDVESDRASEVQIGLVGVPWDGGTTHPARRPAPRKLAASTLFRPNEWYADCKAST